MPERGTMEPRGDGKWLLKIYLGRIDGKRKYSSRMFSGTTSQAKKALTAMLNEKDTGSYVVPSKQTVKDYLTSWLTGKANVETKTKLDYEHRMAKDVYPFIGSVPLTKLTPAHIRTLYGKLASERGLSPRTIRYTHTVLSQALELAVEDGVMQKNPCRRSSVREVIPKKVKTDITILTPEEVRKVLTKETDVMKHALFRLLLTAGLRPQEACALKWEDLTGNTLRIAHALHNVGKGRYEDAPYLKTDGSARQVELSTETLGALQVHRKEQAAAILKAGEKYTRKDYIFATGTGQFVDIANVRRWWKAALTRCSLDERSLYHTRHTHLSHLLESGENPQAVAERSGHKDPTTLLNTYAHTLPGASGRLAERQEAMLRAVK